MKEQLIRVMGLQEWFNYTYPELYGYRVMDKYAEWLAYRNSIMQNNRQVMAKRKREKELNDNGKTKG